MTIVLPRLDRDSALEIVTQMRSESLESITARLPVRPASLTYTPVGGARVDESDLLELRQSMLELAITHGMPERSSRDQLQQFDGRGARLLHQRLALSPHEASHDEVWSFLTVCWLFDIAIWRFGSGTDENRFVGHLNRNTFRRLWWRAEILGPEVDLTRLGEDELVNIMERPTLFSDRRVARSIALEHLNRLDTGAVEERMRVMREVTKRLLRLTPFVAFAALVPADLDVLVADAFDAVVEGLAGESSTMPIRARQSALESSVDVIAIQRMTITQPEEPLVAGEPHRRSEDNFEEVAQAALDIARRTGRVTNNQLRELAPISADEARDVLQALLKQGSLVRRGVARGTHYILPDPEPAATPEIYQRELPPVPQVGRTYAASSSETALRRLLQRDAKAGPGPSRQPPPSGNAREASKEFMTMPNAPDPSDLSGTATPHPNVLEELASWSDCFPFGVAAETAPKQAGVFLVALPGTSAIIYVGMAGERNGIAGRLQGAASGRAMSEIGEAALDHALQDAGWLRERLGEVEQGHYARTRDWMQAAISYVRPLVCWAVTPDNGSARDLEQTVLQQLADDDLWIKSR